MIEALVLYLFLLPAVTCTDAQVCVHPVQSYSNGLEYAKVLTHSGDQLTLLDMVAMQYMLNGGIIMRQAHDTEDEYHIEVGARDGDNESLCSNCTDQEARCEVD